MLLEAMIALTVFGIAGMALAAYATEATRALAHASATERETRRASAFLDAVALWTRDDLDRHLGERSEGPWRLRIERPLPTLYVVVLQDTSAGHRTVLQTELFRESRGAGSN